MAFNRVEIDLGALRHNYRTLAAMLPPGVSILAMVKSEAYGHGLEPCARALADAGAQAFGVAEVEEGIRLRRAGVSGDILVTLGLAPDDDPADLVRYDLQPVIFDVADVERLATAAGRNTVAVHVKVDVGMGRFGVMPNGARELVSAVSRAANLRIAGLMAHFPLADEDSRCTMRHLETFRAVVEPLRRLAGEACRLHIANSAAMLDRLGVDFDWVRPGIALYGGGPPAAGTLGLRPVMAMKSSVVQVKSVPAGTGISYGHSFVTDRPSRIAVLPVGYDDGYLRRLSNRGQVLIRGQRFNLVGTICMNACMADVTEAPAVRAGDEVVFLGRQGEEMITADEIARWSDTISYEIFCLLGSRNRRVYVEDDEATERPS